MDNVQEIISMERDGSKLFAYIYYVHLTYSFEFHKNLVTPVQNSPEIFETLEIQRWVVPTLSP